MGYTKAVHLEEQHRQWVDQLLLLENIEAKLQDPAAVQTILATINR
jgi:hypothetical protein